MSRRKTFCRRREAEKDALTLFLEFGALLDERPRDEAKIRKADQAWRKQWTAENPGQKAGV